LRIVAEERRERGAASIGRQVTEFQATSSLHVERHRNVQRAVKARRTEDDLVRPLLGVLGEIFERLIRLLIVDQQHARIGDEARDRNEIGAGEFHRPAEQLVDLAKPEIDVMCDSKV